MGIKKYEVYMDGDNWIAIDSDKFKNLQESSCYAFAPTPVMALATLISAEAELKNKSNPPDIYALDRVKQELCIYPYAKEKHDDDLDKEEY